MSVASIFDREFNPKVHALPYMCVVARQLNQLPTPQNTLEMKIQENIVRLMLYVVVLAGRLMLVNFH